jgi:hypothetical protein
LTEYLPCDIDNPPEHCLYHDGVTGTRLATESALVGAGGFFSGMVGANIAVALDDGVPIGLRKLTGAGHEFVGVISTLGFRKFQFVELDGKIGQALAIFADDFAFGAVRNECPSALACSYFNIDAEDWAVIDWPDIQVGPAAWTGSTGNPGGSIFPNDPDTGDRYFSAPAKFLGDKSAAYGGTLTYDMLVTDSDTPPWDQPFISITGGNMTLNWTAAAWPVVNAWNTYEVRLDETGGWTRSSDNSTPTASEFASVLSSLSALIVRGEFRSGTNRGYLDNVVLASDISILTVTKAGAGRGTVTSDPAGISCGSTCLAPFSSNATVTLTATADSGSTFAGWSPSPCAATFAMPTTDLTCTATFEFCWACLPSRGGWRSAIR